MNSPPLPSEALFPAQTLTYDANGNLIADANNTDTWDARNHLTGITGTLPPTTTQLPHDQQNGSGISGQPSLTLNVTA